MDLSIRSLYCLEVDGDVGLRFAREFCNSNHIPYSVQDISQTGDMLYKIRMLMTDAELRELVDQLNEENECQTRS